MYNAEGDFFIRIGYSTVAIAHGYVSVFTNVKCYKSYDSYSYKSYDEFFLIIKLAVTVIKMPLKFSRVVTGIVGNLRVDMGIYKYSRIFVLTHSHSRVNEKKIHSI